MARPSNVRWHMVGLVVLAGACAYVLRTNLSFAAPALKADFGLSEVQLGVVLSAFAVTYALFQIPGGLIGERYGPRRVMTVLCASWGVVTILSAIVPSRTHAPVVAILALLVLLRGLLGALQAPAFPVGTGGTQTTWLEPSRWGLGNAVQNAGFNLATAVAAPIGVWLITQFGWRVAILLSSPSALILAGLWWWYNRDNPRDHWRINAEELALIEATHAGLPAATPRGELRAALNRPLILLTLSYFSLNYVFYLFFNWFYYYLTEVRGFSAALGGFFTGAQWILGGAAALAGGVLCDWLSRRYGPARGCRLTAMTGILFAAPCVVLGAMMDNPLVVVTLLSISFASTQLVDPAYWVATVQVAGPRAQFATGLLNTGGNLSGGLAAILVPVIAKGLGWTAAVGSAVLFAMIAAVMWLWIEGGPESQLQAAGELAPSLQLAGE